MLHVQSISKCFGANQVLRDVSFTIRDGEILGLIGPNGAGKTTLFECLAGLIPADSGAVSAGGREIAPGERKSVLYYIPDSIRPWRDQPVRWVLSFFEAMHRAPAGRAMELAGALQLRELLWHRVGALSKGESKRLLVALGLLTPHQVLLLDEPFDGLDFRQAREMMALLREVPANQNRTLFLSIHQLADAARVCDRLVLLSRGRVAGEGALDELRRAALLDSGGLEEVFLALT